MFQNAAKELLTLRDFLRFAVSRFHQAQVFFGHGSSNAYDEAAYLILHSLHLPPDRLEPFLDARLTAEERTTVLTILERRIADRTPAAYLTREAWLGVFNFYVDERVIIPRSFITELLGDGLTPWIPEPESVTSVLDLCTGSGCLAILAALTFPGAQVDAADISEPALEVARINVNRYHLENRVRLVHSDLFRGLTGQRYDLILSNPPYVSAESMAGLPDEYLHEPSIALASGYDGLDHIRVILREAAQHLNEGGILVVESGHNRETLEQAFPKLAFTWLEVSAGDEFVFLLSREQLLDV